MPLAFVQALVEGDIEESILQRILVATGRNVGIVATYGCQGRDYVIQKASTYCAAGARDMPYVVLLDLEGDPCPSDVIRRMFPQTPQYAVTRIMQRMSEAWLIADRPGVSALLGIPARFLPADPEQEPHPKRLLIDLIRQHSPRRTREAFTHDGGYWQGPQWSAEMKRFVRERWDLGLARQHAPSLDRAVNAIARLIG
jgi:hypothetical protein